MDDLKHHIPPQFVYVILAGAGGIARYLSAYEKRNGKFAWGALFVAGFVSGFSGYMFALLGISTSMPQPMIYMLAGIGGFMGENALRFMAEYLMDKFKNK